MLILLASSCTDSGEVSSRRSDRLGSPAGEDPTVFVQRQRQFQRALSGSEGRVDEFVRPDFMLRDELMVDSANRRVPGSIPGNRAALTDHYIRLMNGDVAVPGEDSASYEVYRAGRMLTVVITSPRRGLPFITMWDSTAAGWQVASMVINAAPASVDFQRRAAQARADRVAR